MTPIEILQTALLAMFNGDEAALEPLLADDTTVVDPDDAHVGKAAVLAAYGHRELVFSNVSISIGATDTVTTRGWAEFTVSATHSGDIEQDDVQIKASGNPITLKGVAVCDTSDGRAASIRVYYDGLDLLAGAGLLPTG